jgi:hypothetical protein
MDLQNNPPALIRRLAGLGIAIGGGYITRLAWIQAARDGQFSTLGGFGGPGFVVLGLGLVLFKGYRQERLEHGEDISHLQGLALLTPRWKAVLVVALVAGLADFGRLSGWW